VDDRYGAPSFSSELIFERIPGAPVHHCSTLTEAPNGDLVCVWYGGSYESADDQVLFVSRRKQGERHWSEPEVLEKGEPLHPPGNALVFRAGPERLGLVWGRMDSSRPLRRGGGWGECQLMARYSNDSGLTWTETTTMEGYAGFLPRNVPITLDSGELAIPVTGHLEGKRGGFLLLTSDGGETWRHSGVMRGGSQPTVIQRDDSSLFAFLRSEPYILRTESRDGGRTWSETERTDLHCPGSGIAMRRLRNGHLVLVHNDSPNDRSPLNIVRSTDEGATWSDSRILEPNPGEYSYPCVLQTSDGAIHITYTFRRYAIKHVELNEDWLVHLERPN
jgi:predicted neuraminidase